jgi:signal peptidase I
VFRLPSEPNVNYLKRVIGLPGDEVVYERHRLTVNGEPVAVTPSIAGDSQADQFVEQLGERQHGILVTNPRNSMRDGRYTVPEGHYFMMGDNRDNSRDSRFIGAIPETHLVGEAVRIWMHMDGLEWPEWARIGTKIE